MAARRQRRADLQPAERLGGRQARRTEGRRAMLVRRLPQGAEGPVQPDPAALLRPVELLEEQAGREEPARVPRHAPERREAGCGEPGLRHSALSEVQRLQDMGRGGSAQGRALALSDQGRRPEGRRHLLAGAAAHRRPDLDPGDPGPDDRALLQGRGDGEDPRLGRSRARRLQANLIEDSDASPWPGRPRGRARVFPINVESTRPLPRFTGEVAR